MSHHGRDWQRLGAEDARGLAIRAAGTGRRDPDGDRRRDGRTRAAGGPARHRQGDRPVYRAGRRGRRGAPALVRHVLGHPDDRRTQSRRQIPAGDDPRRSHLPGDRNPRQYRLSGFQVLAGTGLTPRRMAGYVSDTDLNLSSGAFALVLSAAEPAAHILGAAHWIPIPADASSIVVREYIGDADTEDRATMDIDCVDAEPLQPITDAEAAEQFTAMAWTIVKLATLHRTVKPELLTQPNALLSAEAAELGNADTTPDNLYMIGTFALEPDESLVLEFSPPDTRYWSITLESIWHECLEPRHRHSSVTNKGCRPDVDGIARIASAPRTSGTATGWTPAVGAAASSCCAGSTTPSRPPCAPRSVAARWRRDSRALSTGPVRRAGVRAGRQR